jgi:hypothetical protein
MEAIVINGRWSNLNGDPLNTLESQSLPNQISKITQFAGTSDLNSVKIEMLSRILSASTIQQLAILRILDLNDEEASRII